MEKTEPLYQAYLDILRRELVPATGCTEPIAIAWAAATARDCLGTPPDRVELLLSGGIVKNAKSAAIPGTNGRRGIPTAVAAGVCAGDAAKQLEVIAAIPPGKLAEIEQYADETPVEVGLTSGEHLFEIILTAHAGQNKVKLRILDAHTNLVSAEKNGAPLDVRCESGAAACEAPPYGLLTVADIVRFAEAADPADLAPLAGRMCAYNRRIALEGLSGNYGANIGKGLLAGTENPDVRTRAKAWAAAASDARMGGCELPVIITAGSGNQGLTASLPVIVYAEEYSATEDKLHRALALSALLTVHQKDAIGKLSAFCGAVCAGAGAGAGIAWLRGGGYVEIAHALVNALAVLSGMVCDGAKPSCAAKIAMAVEAGILGCDMYAQGQQFYRGEGLVATDVEKTIANVGRIGRDGMLETNREILRIMTQDPAMPNPEA